MGLMHSLSTDEIIKLTHYLALTLTVDSPTATAIPVISYERGGPGDVMAITSAGPCFP